MRRANVLITVIIAITLLTSCVAAPPVAPSPPGGERHCRLPETGRDFTAVNATDVGVEPNAVQSAIGQAMPFTTSLRVYRNDCLIGKTLLDDGTKWAPQQLFSMTKSVVSLLVGRAVTLGRLSIDDPISRYLPEADAAHGAVTIRELLTQSSGLTFAWANDLLGGLNDSTRLVLSLPFAHEPGTWFDYAQAPVTLLGVIVTRAVGEDLQTFAAHELFEPIGITAGNWSWARDAAWNTYGYAWLAMAPVALGRLGALMLHEGSWQGRELIDPAYIHEMGEPTATNGGYGLLTRTNRGRDGYSSFGRFPYTGKQWKWAPDDMTEFSGFLDQVVDVVPSLDLVVVRTGITSADGWQHTLFRTVIMATKGAGYDDPGPWKKSTEPDQAIPVEQLVNLPLLIQQFLHGGYAD